LEPFREREREKRFFSGVLQLVVLVYQKLLCLYQQQTIFFQGLNKKNSLI